ncbi:MAG TPA: glycosyltransferase [Bacteroidales bacterium]|nr:glycosyltransferase [Bacteroidales bacterium]HRW85076.1 glycosyltransferase [Bacteroidales bacterium]
MKFIVLGTAHPYRGGLAAYIERLTRQLLDEGHDTQIFTFTLQYPRVFFPGKTQYTDAPPPGNMKITRILNSINPFSWIKTGLRIRKQKPDILLIKYWHPFMSPCFGTVARIVKRRREGRLKVICIFDNVIPHEKSIIDRMLTTFFTGSIDGAIVMSGSVGEDLKKFRISIPVLFNPHPLYDNYGTPLDKEEALMRLNLDKDCRYLLFFGFIRAYKGLDLLLEAFADRRLRAGKFKLLVAGEFYEDDTPYRKIIDNHSIGADVILYDRFIREDEVACLFSAADLVVQPYRNATQSGVTQIAYHFEKPVLVTNVGGLAEIIPHGKCGYVVDPDPRNIADAIEDFFTRGRTDEFKKGIREEKAKFTWDKLTESIMEVYHRI